MKPEMPPQGFAEKFKRQLNELKVDEEACEQIESRTHPNQFEQKRLHLTAPHFLTVCIRKDSTLCGMLIKTLLHSKSFNFAAENRKQREKVAIQLYTAEMKRNVKQYRLFVDLEYRFLATSPDGLVGEDQIAEVKYG